MRIRNLLKYYKEFNLSAINNNKELGRYSGRDLGTTKKPAKHTARPWSIITN